MKPFWTISLTTLFLIFNNGIFAAETEKSTVSAPTPVSENKTNITIYESPNITAKIVKTLPSNANLVGFFRQGDWIKVGDQQDGVTGWVNLNQYHPKQDDFTQNIQTHSESVYLHASKNKDGSLLVEAYQDGKKLTSEESKKLYEKMQAQQREQWDAMQRFNQNLTQELQMGFVAPKKQEHTNVATPIFFLPGIVIIENPTASQSDTTKKQETK